MNCVNCSNSFSLVTSLEKAKFSWPRLRTFWYSCIDCAGGNHIRISQGRYNQIKIIGAPGPEWEEINIFSENDLTYRQDEEFLHVWLNDNYYEIKAKV